MIQSFTIVNYLDEILYLDIRRPEDTGFLVNSVTGLNYPKTDISSQTYSTYDGSHFGGFHVDQRNIVMNIIFYEDNKEKLSIEDLRWKLMRYFLPKTELKFYATNEHGTFLIKGYIESCEINIFTKQEGAQISILCPDPHFILSTFNIDSTSTKNDNISSISYDEENKAIIFRSNLISEIEKPIIISKNNSIANVKPLFHFPLSIEANKFVSENTPDRFRTLEFGSIKSYPKTVIEYKGTAETGFVITITVKSYSVNGLRINNVTRNEYVAIDDSKLKDLVSGGGLQRHDIVIIDTKKGSKSAKLIRNGVTYNILNACLPVKKWPRLQTGDNIFTYSADNINNVDISLDFETLFFGI